MPPHGLEWQTSYATTKQLAFRIIYQNTIPSIIKHNVEQQQKTAPAGEVAEDQSSDSYKKKQLRSARRSGMKHASPMEQQAKSQATTPKAFKLMAKKSENLPGPLRTMGIHYKKMSTENGLLRRSMENTAILPDRRYYKSQEGMKASFVIQA